MTTVAGPLLQARHIHLQGVVQGVGFRPYVFRVARAHAITGWVLNGDDGVHIHVEGDDAALDSFLTDLVANAPAAARIAAVDVAAAEVRPHDGFEIRLSESVRHPTTRIAPDLPVCSACLTELFDAHDRRHRYPYINCTNCGPRFSIVLALPYDRRHTTMAAWPLCSRCAAEYTDPADRRFHAQPVACAVCGPQYRLVIGGRDVATADDAIVRAAGLLCQGGIVAVKGIGGYHLACDAGNAATVAMLRDRKFRKEQAFAVMVPDVAVAEQTVDLTQDARNLLLSSARPIVVAPARMPLIGVAPENCDIGVMLPYTPLHHLLFASGAPLRLVMTSGNRSSEPIAYDDEDALERLEGLADAWLVGERPIARRVDDSVIRAGVLGPMVLRRSRGLAPAVAATLPGAGPILAVGADLKNAITLVVDGQAYVSQHIGDLSHVDARRAFADTIRDLLAMYAIRPADLTVVHDRHPDYASTAQAIEMNAPRTVAVQHHHAHVASVLAERGAFDRPVVGIALDGTGYGDDGAIWGGEFFVGSVRGGFLRAAHLRKASLAGGDAAARFPVQAAAGFLSQLASLPDLTQPPFCFPDRYAQAAALIASGVRAFPTTSAGRLFDTVAALVGFTRPISFEGQAAIWLEHLARGAASAPSLQIPCPFTGSEIDWRPTLAGVIAARIDGTPPALIARAFHCSFARAIARAAIELAYQYCVDTIVLSGGVMQNALLLEKICKAVAGGSLQLWINQEVPPNDGGVSLGQAALAAFSERPSGSVSADP